MYGSRNVVAESLLLGLAKRFRKLAAGLDIPVWEMALHFLISNRLNLFLIVCFVLTPYCASVVGSWCHVLEQATTFKTIKVITDRSTGIAWKNLALLTFSCLGNVGKIYQICTGSIVGWDRTQPWSFAHGRRNKT